MLERLKHAKETLMCCVESQLGHLDKVDAEELGEVVDMVKDLEEAIYYCTITKAMNQKEHEGNGQMNYRDMDRDQGRMYYDGRSMYGGDPSMMYYDGRDGNSSSGNNGSNAQYSEREYPVSMRDYREGRSPQSRRMYMESKEMHKDKASQLKELERYMQELTQDIVEMIDGASPEEKQYLEKRLTALASKI